MTPWGQVIYRVLLRFEDARKAAVEGLLQLRNPAPAAITESLDTA